MGIVHRHKTTQNFRYQALLFEESPRCTSYPSFIVLLQFFKTQNGPRFYSKMGTMKSVMQAYCIQKHMSGDYIGTLKLIMPCAAMPHNKYQANNDLIDAERVFIFAPVFVAISLSQGKFKNR